MPNQANRSVRNEEHAPYSPDAPVRMAPSMLAHEERVLAEAFDILDRRMTKGEAMSDPSAAGKYAKVRLADRPSETFMVLFMDTRHRLIACEELFHGTVDGCEVHPRVVATRALHHNAAAVILAHNHPSGSSEPSAADRTMTARLKQALLLFDVRVLDHFVCGAGEPVSLAARGWI